MRSYNRNFKNNNDLKNIMIFSIYFIMVISIFAYFFYCIGHVEQSAYVSNDEYQYIAAAGNFNSSLPLDIEDFDEFDLKLNEFINNVFSTRNNAFLNGDVTSLYDYYNMDNSNGRYSLDYEFRRISYLRDWSFQRAILFTGASSLVIINEISKKDGKVIVNLDEHYTFNYMHNKSPAVNKFTFSIPHILTIATDDYCNFKIDKDYYCDVFNDDLDSYVFSLNETSLPYTAEFNANYETSATYFVDDIIRYEKMFYTDHKAVICGYDSNGYPLIDSNTLNISNMPFDLGWRERNIKLSY